MFDRDKYELAKTYGFKDWVEILGNDQPDEVLSEEESLAYIEWHEHVNSNMYD